MLLSEMVRVGLQSIRASLFRATLTMLGIVIGVGSVIAMVALSSGAQREIDEQLRSLGTDILMVRPGSRFRPGVAEAAVPLSADDAEAIVAHADTVVAVVPEKLARVPVKLGHITQRMALVGTTPEFAAIYDLRIREGRFFGQSLSEANKRVAIVGAAVPIKLRTDAAALLGKTLTMGGIGFEVIGVLEPRGSIGWQNVDEQIWVPLVTAQTRLLGSADVDMIRAKVRPDESLDIAMVDIEQVLRREHRIAPGKANDFTLGDPAEFLNARRETNQVFAYLLAGIAAVSLLVGGIGTMNIMLVTVSERTGEIGLRKAIGASKSNIHTQFLIEAVVLCTLGGFGGVVLGIASADLMRRLLGWEVLVSPDSVAIAVGFSMLVGLIFGFLPARKAARLNPVEALRYE